jgi:hypothetical protein
MVFLCPCHDLSSHMSSRSLPLKVPLLLELVLMTSYCLYSGLTTTGEIIHNLHGPVWVQEINTLGCYLPQQDNSQLPSSPVPHRLWLYTSHTGLHQGPVPHCCPVWMLCHPQWGQKSWFLEEIIGVNKVCLAFVNNSYFIYLLGTDSHMLTHLHVIYMTILDHTQ